MEAGTPYRGTLTLTRIAIGITLAYVVERVSDGAVIMSHSATDASSTFTAFDTVAFYLARTARLRLLRLGGRGRTQRPVTRGRLVCGTPVAVTCGGRRAHPVRAGAPAAVRFCGSADGSGSSAPPARAQGPSRGTTRPPTTVRSTFNSRRRAGGGWRLVRLARSRTAIRLRVRTDRTRPGEPQFRDLPRRADGGDRRGGRVPAHERRTQRQVGRLREDPQLRHTRSVDRSIHRDWRRRERSRLRRPQRRAVSHALRPHRPLRWQTRSTRVPEYGFSPKNGSYIPNAWNPAGSIAGRLDKEASISLLLEPLAALPEANPPRTAEGWQAFPEGASGDAKA